MAYTINQGYQESHVFDKVQRGLLFGLPALALILSFGALRHHSAVNNPAGQNAKLIPIVSSLSNGSKPDSQNNGNSSSPSGGNSAPGNPSGGVSGLTAGNAASSPTGTSSPLVGGMGGGPTGGGTTGGTGGGTTVTIPDCSLNQIATITCRVPACSPEVTLAPGQKAILGIGGTCVVVN
jgi:hypothetical protein